MVCKREADGTVVKEKKKRKKKKVRVRNEKASQKSNEQYGPGRTPAQDPKYSTDRARMHIW